MEEATHFTDEESTQGTHGHTETGTEVFRLPATGTPVCVCGVGKRMVFWLL